jgi:hypothetical protein
VDHATGKVGPVVARATEPVDHQAVAIDRATMASAQNVRAGRIQSLVRKDLDVIT